MSIDKRQIEEFRERIVDVVQSYGIELKPKAGTLEGICPFHDDHNPSMRVEEDPFYQFRCWVCHQAGDVFDFVAKREGYDIESEFVSVAEVIAGILGTELKFTGKKQTVDEKQKIVNEKTIMEDLFHRADMVRHLYMEWCSKNLMETPAHLEYMTNDRPSGRSRLLESIEAHLIGLAPDDDRRLRDFIKSRFEELGLKLNTACLVASGLFTKGTDRIKSWYKNCYVYAQHDRYSQQKPETSDIEKDQS